MSVEITWQPWCSDERCLPSFCLKQCLSLAYTSSRYCRSAGNSRDPPVSNPILLSLGLRTCATTPNVFTQVPGLNSSPHTYEKGILLPEPFSCLLSLFTMKLFFSQSLSSEGWLHRMSLNLGLSYNYFLPSSGKVRISQNKRVVADSRTESGKAYCKIQQNGRKSSKCR